MIVLIILIASIIVLLTLFFSIFGHRIGNKTCNKCGKNVLEVSDRYYYKTFQSSATRYRCADHKLKGYTEIRLPKKEYKYQSNKYGLSRTEKQINDIVIYDDNFIKIIQTIDHEKKLNNYNLLIMNEDITNFKTKNCGIYKFTNLHNGKIYIGQSKQIDKRWIQHQRTIYSSNILHSDLIRHPFKKEVILYCPEEYLDFLECYFIKKLNTYNGQSGYNMVFGNYKNLPFHFKKVLNDC